MTVNKLHNELYYLNFSRNIIRVTESRRMGWAGMRLVWEEESCIYGFGGKSLKKEATWKCRCRWRDNIQLHLKYIERGSVLD
jgi:hypothetical protein